MPSERITEAARARQALDFLDQAFVTVLKSYSDRMMDIAAEKPWEAEKITKLAMALKIARSVRSQIEGIALDGKVAESEMAYSAQIERIPAHKRSILGI